MTTCIGCGCDEGHACTLPGGTACAWTHTSAGGAAGLCTGCGHLFDSDSIDDELEVAEGSMIEEARRGPGGSGLILPGDADFGL